MTTVVAAVIENGGRILICRRRPDQPHALKWEFPGGKVEPGETQMDALQRELHEELGIRAEIGACIADYEYAYPGRQPIRLSFYSVNKFEGEVTNRVFSDIRWEPRELLPSYDFLEGDVAFVRALAEKR
jgi:8-oxo-dGTP diphosphatase